MVARPQVNGISANDSELCMDCLPAKTRAALLFFSSLDLVKSPWYLAGGTALALQAGHRRSFDLDFFTPRATFDLDVLERGLVTTKNWKTTMRQKGTLYGEWKGAKMSFIAYPFFRPGRVKIPFGTIKILPKEDIAVMKVIAVSQRGRKRDFIDLHWYCTHVEPLASLLKRAPKQYPGQEHNLPHFFKSLVYFADAEEDPDAGMRFSVSWRTVKAFFLKETPKAMRELGF